MELAILYIWRVQEEEDEAKKKCKGEAKQTPDVCGAEEAQDPATLPQVAQHAEAALQAEAAAEAARQEATRIAQAQWQAAQAQAEQAAQAEAARAAKAAKAAEEAAAQAQQAAQAQAVQAQAFQAMQAMAVQQAQAEAVIAAQMAHLVGAAGGTGTVRALTAHAQLAQAAKLMQAAQLYSAAALHPASLPEGAALVQPAVSKSAPSAPRAIAAGILDSPFPAPVIPPRHFSLSGPPPKNGEQLSMAKTPSFSKSRALALSQNLIQRS